METFYGVGNSKADWHFDGTKHKTLICFTCSPPDVKCGPGVCELRGGVTKPKGFNLPVADPEHVGTSENNCNILSSNVIHMLELGRNSSVLHRGPKPDDVAPDTPHKRICIIVGESRENHFTFPFFFGSHTGLSKFFKHAI